eukprot:TRINITY_DN8729_c0_g1_i1.p1 TRINITY_DN8729_c0_g1~~TRINITY_DN8729_c0_g1_i1.p1  ORF type:complete len:313 (+),score=51.61 TRINITY_DN8729_c0_g1_i1:14-952(+)
MKSVISILLLVSLVVLESNGQLYGLKSNPTQLFVYNTQTGESKAVGDSIPFEVDGPVGSVDDKHGLFYTIGYNTSTQDESLIGLSLKTGRVEVEVKLPFATEGFVGVGETVDVDPETGDVFVSGHDPTTSGKHHFTRYIVSSKTFDSITIVPDGDILGAPSTYDSDNKIIWTQYYADNNIKLYGIDVVNKIILHEIINTENLDGMNFDPETGLIYGVGLHINNKTSYYRTVLSFNPKSLKFKIINTIPGYFLMEAGAYGMNTKDHEIYCIMQPKSGTTNRLLTLSYKTGDLITAPNLCKTLSDCPSVLGYAN